MDTEYPITRFKEKRNTDKECTHYHEMANNEGT